MKIIQFLVTFFYSALYTSSIWAAVMWKGLSSGPNNIQVLTLVSGVLTAINIIAISIFIIENWSKKLT